MANAWFMVGAYHLGFRRLAEAEAAFGEYGKAAERSGERGSAMLAAGYVLLAQGLATRKNDLSRLLGVHADTMRLQDVEHSEEFARQIETAGRVFGAR